ncbi:TetR/AcrR family transcriptional regulator [Aquicoccus sp. G2-2]|uniref:TetR/AcrR family transcriptional regulator n=1 Tax=Aquicoccus sp. G2-2 TaxID=3092120 RepID=UPI002AE00E74|nr:TetR/AcrR family transcriptional regulator [Aquicoccus sp. G2-2]MEA1115278.1 TetR/AcrR family transcriptional regulator [Aquicoccus sp. G2-2]
MAQTSDQPTATAPEAPGLRSKKKARRRQEILRCAGRLFARDGFDATTMATIASEADVSPPTVFNYFGSKENILSALIFEGTEDERTRHLKSPRKTNCNFADVLADFLCDCANNTMRIAGKRVWRYVEATNIRRPGSDFQRRFDHSDTELHNLFARFLSAYDIVLRNGQTPDTRFLAWLFYDRWSARYFAYIKDDDMPMSEHETQVRSDVDAMVALLFDDDFTATSPLKKADPINDQS